jgi:hypothetical protein
MTTDTTKPESPEILHLFHSTLENCQYVFKDGQTAVFKGNRYATSKPQYIKELQEEVALKHPMITIDPNKKTITYEELLPDYELKQRLRAEIMAELASR